MGKTAVLRSSRDSVCKQAQVFQVDRSAVRHIINREFHPYKMAIVQQLKSAIFHHRSEFTVETLFLFEVNETI